MAGSVGCDEYDLFDKGIVGGWRAIALSVFVMSGWLWHHMGMLDFLVVYMLLEVSFVDCSILLSISD